MTFTQSRPAGGAFVSPLPERVNTPQSATLLSGEFLNRFTREAGLYGPDGLPLPDSDIQSGEQQTIAAPRLPHHAADIRTIDGPVLFAGLVLEQFGHVIMNSIGRLWALEQMPEDLRRSVTLLYYPKRKSSRRYYPHLQTVLDLFGVENNYMITAGPMSFAEVHTAPEHFGERFQGRGTQSFFEWVDQKLPAKAPVERGRRLYVSRTGLGNDYGRFACEEHLEGLLARQGYEIYHPQHHSLPEQVAAYQSAEQLIFAEGSALHLFLLVRRPEQQIAVIKRRAELPPLIKQQLTSRPGPVVAEVDAIDEEFWPPKRGSHLSVSLLDFHLLKRQLLAARMIEDLPNWEVPTTAEQAKSLWAGMPSGTRMMDTEERRQFLGEKRRERRVHPAS